MSISLAESESVCKAKTISNENHLLFLTNIYCSRVYTWSSFQVGAASFMDLLSTFCEDFSFLLKKSSLIEQ